MTFLPLLFGSPAHAAGTVAGTQIENIATASFDGPDGGRTEIRSNPVQIRVDELLNVTVSSLMPGDTATSPSASGQVLRFQLTNSGNGPEKFALTVDAGLGGDDFDPLFQQIVIDSNGNNVYDAGVDTVYVSGANEPELQPDESRTIFVLSSIPATVVEGNRAEVALIGTAMTGAGAPGTLFANAGHGGGDALVGSSGATARDSDFFVVTAATLNLVKSAVIADPFGADSPVPGAVITYRITASVNGTGSLNGVMLSDAIPAGTAYRAGSLELDAAPMTDADDSDAAKFAANTVSAALGTMASGTSRELTFKVVIE